MSITETTPPDTAAKLQALEQENRRLNEELRQADRLRRMWQEAVTRLKEARVALLTTQAELTAANTELRQRVEELAIAKRYVEQLAYSDEQVIKHMQEGVLVTDARGTILAVNPAFSEVTGYSAGEVTGQNPRLLKSGRHDDLFYQRMWQTLAESGRWQGEIWNRRKNGEIYPEQLSISAVRDWRDDTVNYIGVFTDITAGKRAEEALRASQQRLVAVTSLLSDGVLMLDGEQRITFANPEACRLLAQPEAKLLGQRRSDVLEIIEPRGPYLLPPGTTVREFVDCWNEADFEDLHLKRLADGALIPITLASSPIIKGNEIVGAVIAFHDVSRRKGIEAQLVKLSRAVEHSPSMVVITNLEGRIEYVNPRFSEITGYTPDEVVGKGIGLLKSGRTPPDVYANLWETISTGHDWHGEFLNRKKSGELFWMMVSISPIVDGNGTVTHFVSVEEDITERKRSEEKIWYQANYDSLTGLPNRRLFQDRLQQALTQALHGGQMGALLFIDLDRFKYVNDTLGHDAGDRLLQEAARRLTDNVGEGDTLTRLGGDEFTIVLPQLSGVHEAEAIARNLIAALAPPFRIDGQELFVSGSVGVALFPEDGVTVEDLLKHADAAMYRAKDRGRSTFAFYTEDINDTSLRRIAMENELRRALERDEFTLAYQPILQLDGDHLAGVECLLRWNNAQFGSVSPGLFIGIAEEAGLMPAIGDWVLHTACRQAQEWRRRHDVSMPISVNLSLAQLKTEEFPGRLKDILAETGLPPALLVLEVTESMMMDDPEHYLALIGRIAALGVQVAIDDFGTGYSSLSYIKRLRAGTIKIDQSFVRDLPANPDDVTIVKTVIAMAHNLNMSVTAEGVECPEQLDFLRRAGCDRTQGFLHATPMSAEDLDGYLATLRSD